MLNSFILSLEININSCSNRSLRCRFTVPGFKPVAYLRSIKVISRYIRCFRISPFFSWKIIETASGLVITIFSLIFGGDNPLVFLDSFNNQPQPYSLFSYFSEFSFSSGFSVLFSTMSSFCGLNFSISTLL